MSSSDSVHLLSLNSDFIVLWNITYNFFFSRNREANEFMQFTVLAEEQFGLAVAAGSLCIHGKFVSILSVIRSMHHCDNLIIYPLSTVQLHTGISTLFFLLSLSLCLEAFTSCCDPIYIFSSPLKVEQLFLFPNIPKLQTFCSDSVTNTKHLFFFCIKSYFLEIEIMFM